ncbi:hypothetical protein EV679_3021 [Kerstersia gyiorum]|uniref:Uncharacterized protein n=1 Tax=Kerstersia gyiorum TaxID=206506 RepID=A0A4Q7MBB9_9BURK|nr:hypothetical protein EV679_3021 [Kerstersia gyiorum]
MRLRQRRVAAAACAREIPSRLSPYLFIQPAVFPPADLSEPIVGMASEAPKKSWCEVHTAHRTAPHRTAPHRTAPHRTAPHGVAWHAMALLRRSRPGWPRGGCRAGRAKVGAMGKALEIFLSPQGAANQAGNGLGMARARMRRQQKADSRKQTAESRQQKADSTPKASRGRSGLSVQFSAARREEKKRRAGEVLLCSCGGPWRAAA